jgi:hypothetical protein
MHVEKHVFCLPLVCIISLHHIKPTWPTIKPPTKLKPKARNKAQTASPSAINDIGMRRRRPF